jgi:hypothetical protein
MSAMFEFPAMSEILDGDELAQITGCARKSDQASWLKKQRWVHILNKAGIPIVGRMYARMKLAGIEPASLSKSDAGWSLDLSKIK